MCLTTRIYAFEIGWLCSSGSIATERIFSMVWGAQVIFMHQRTHKQRVLGTSHWCMLCPNGNLFLLHPSSITTYLFRVHFSLLAIRNWNVTFSRCKSYAIDSAFVDTWHFDCVAHEQRKYAVHVTKATQLLCMHTKCHTHTQHTHSDVYELAGGRPTHAIDTISSI